MPKVPSPLRFGLVLPLLAGLVLAGCGGDSDSPGASVSPVQTQGGADPLPEVSPGTAGYALSFTTPTVTVVEGQGSVRVGIAISRAEDYSGTITLAAGAANDAQAEGLEWSFSDLQISQNEGSSQLDIALNYSVAPIGFHQRQLRVVGTDGAGNVVDAWLTLDMVPTQRPDIYLLVGQSNMVGSSEFGAREAGAGQADEPVARILQLNPNSNIELNYPTASSFTNSSNIVSSPTLITALDPLHAYYDQAIGDKAGENQIGMGLSFAKRALAETSANIVLVPAAWGGSGFCKNDGVHLDGMGWNAEAVEDDAFAGTLLFDRAVARANIAINESNGILRGILWHQGSADSNSDVCAERYADNIQKLAAGLRTRIVQDARGAVARGTASDVPFIVGTLARGSDERGDYSTFTPNRDRVDQTLRNVPNLIPHAATVIADDLVPPAYDCGAYLCIHFGADALRELGARYYQALYNLTRP